MIDVDTRPVLAALVTVRVQEPAPGFWMVWVDALTTFKLQLLFALHVRAPVPPPVAVTSIFAPIEASPVASTDPFVALQVMLIGSCDTTLIVTPVVKLKE